MVSRRSGSRSRLTTGSPHRSHPLRSAARPAGDSSAPTGPVPTPTAESVETSTAASPQPCRTTSSDAAQMNHVAAAAAPRVSALNGVRPILIPSTEDADYPTRRGSSPFVLTAPGLSIRELRRHDTTAKRADQPRPERPADRREGVPNMGPRRTAYIHARRRAVAVRSPDPSWRDITPRCPALSAPGTGHRGCEKNLEGSAARSERELLRCLRAEDVLDMLDGRELPGARVGG